MTLPASGPSLAGAPQEKQDLVSVLGDRRGELKRVRTHVFQHMGRTVKAFVPLFEEIGRQIGLSIKNLIRTQPEMSLANIAQVPYVEVMEDLENIVATHLVGGISITPLSGFAFAEIRSEFGLILVDRLLGGPGWKPKEERTFSRVEIDILTRVFHSVMKALVDALQRWVTIDPYLEWCEERPRLPSPAPGVPTLMIQGRYNISTPYFVGEMAVWLPHQPIDSTLHPKNRIEGPPIDADWLQKKLGDLNLEMSAMLGEVTLSVKDLLALSPGHLLVLNSTIRDEVSLSLNNRLKMKGRPGLHYESGMKAVKISHLIRRSDEEEGVPE
jgi:flagellar motor switch protein FliM